MTRSRRRSDIRGRSQGRNVSRMKTSGIEGPQLDASDDIEISDEELTLLAMAADPDAELGADAVPLRPEGGFPELLPSWYMPVPASAGGGTGRKLAVVAIIASLLLINGLGLCVTYGFIQVA